VIFPLERNLLILCLILLLKDPSVIAGQIDISHEPDPSLVSRIARDGQLAEFHRELGNALALQWKPAVSGRSGSFSLENIAGWVDLYQWIDLLVSEEASVTKRWLSHHFSVSREQTTQGVRFHVTIHQPGAPLVRRYDQYQHRVTEELAGNSQILGQVLTGLVRQPFESRNGTLISRLDGSFVEATIQNKSFWKSWSDAFGEDDFAPRVLLNLQSIWKSSPADWQEYQNLALAIAMVHDQPLPDSWPHRQVAPVDVTKGSSEPYEIFSSVVDAFRKGKLQRDPRRLDVCELKFVVDAPVAASDLDYIRNSASRSRELPPHAFHAISYDQERVLKDSYVWPCGTYSLASIRNHGGICVDQAYYAAVSGKALGIPTIFFAGEGRDGGHAWVGYLKNHGNWDLNVGRHGEKNVATGVALDPKNWSPVTDHDITMMSLNSRNRVAREASRRDLVMATIFRRRNDALSEGQALRSALSRCPEDPLFWDALEDWLVRTGSTCSEIQHHHEAAIRQFSRFRDLKTQHQAALARLAEVSGDRNTVKYLSEQIIRENFGVRNDLSAGAAGVVISSQMKANDPESALRFYEEQLRTQGVAGRGEFFYRVTAPLAGEFITKQRPDLARRVLKRAFETIKPPRGSLLDKELRKLWLKAGGKP